MFLLIHYKSLWIAAAMKNSPAHVTIQKQGEQQTQQYNELTQGKASVICSRMPFSKIQFLRDDSLLYKASLKKLVHTKI